MNTHARVAGWWVLLAAVGWLVLASASDRLAGQGLLVAPGMAGEGGQALTARAWLTWQRGQPDPALARAAVRRRPTDAVTLRVAGFALLASDPVVAEVLLRLAGAAGWRDGPTQFYWARAALDGGGWDVAAERLDALERTNAATTDSVPLLRALERTPAGRAALARRAGVPGDAWLAFALARMDGLDPAGLTAREAAVRAIGPRLPRAGLDRIGWSFVRADAGDRAWRLLATGDRLSFEPPADPAEPGPFSWTLLPAAGLDASLGKGMLLARASGPAVLPLASRLVRLPIGPSVLTIRVAGARTALPLLATIDCPDGPGVPANVLPARSGSVRFGLTAPAGCTIQRLTLLISGEEAAGGAELRLTDAWISVAAAP